MRRRTRKGIWGETAVIKGHLRGSLKAPNEWGEGEK